MYLTQDWDQASIHTPSEHKVNSFHFGGKSRTLVTSPVSKVLFKALKGFEQDRTQNTMDASQAHRGEVACGA